jgi:hypothetical protein
MWRHNVPHGKLVAPLFYYIEKGGEQVQLNCPFWPLHSYILTTGAACLCLAKHAGTGRVGLLIVVKCIDMSGSRYFTTGRYPLMSEPCSPFSNGGATQFSATSINYISYN